MARSSTSDEDATKMVQQTQYTREALRLPGRRRDHPEACNLPPNRESRNQRRLSPRLVISYSASESQARRTDVVLPIFGLWNECRAHAIRPRDFHAIDETRTGAQRQRLEAQGATTEIVYKIADPELHNIQVEFEGSRKRQTLARSLCRPGRKSDSL